MEKTKKKTSYQKLKDKNKDLMSDIRSLVHRDTPFMEKSLVSNRYIILFDMEDQIWFGSPSIKM